MPSSCHAHLKGEFPVEDIDFLKNLLGNHVSLSSGKMPKNPKLSILVGGRFTDHDIAPYPNLRSIIIPWAGVPPGTLELVRKCPDISLHNIHHNSVSASEMAITLMLAAAKRIIPADRALRNNDWSPRYKPNGMVIDNSRVLVVGWGAIGARIGKICQAMGARVKGISRRGFGNTYTPESLHHLLPETDIVFICVPSTAATTDLISEKQLSLLPDNSILVNIARGNVVNEKALYRALKGGTLGAAGLDVWYNYPSGESSRTNTPPSEYPFCDLPNVVMSPHRGGAFGLKSQEEKRMSALASVIKNILFGKPDGSLVDLNAGY